MWTVAAGVTTGVSQALVDSVLAVTQLAADYWGRYIRHDAGSIDIVIDIVDLPDGVLATGGADLYFDHSDASFDYYAPATIIELTGGGDQNGSAGDIYIEVDLSTLQSSQYFLFAGGGSGASAGSAGKYDLWTVMVHEIAHGLGLMSFLDLGGTDRTTFDAFVSTAPGGYSFIGPNAGALSLDSSFAHLASSYGSVLSPTIAPGVALYLTPRELGLFHDLGLTPVAATSGADVLNGYGDLAYIVGGLAGNDSLYGLPSSDELRGGLDDDLIQGWEGDDRLGGDDGDDTIKAGAGDDTVLGDPGADDINGGAGADQINYTSSAAAVNIMIGAAATGGDADGDTLAGIESVVATLFDDRVTGSAALETLAGWLGADTIIGGAGADRIHGYAPGNLDDASADLLIGGAGADSLFGDALDIASYKSSPSGVNINLSAATSTGGDAQGDVFSGIDALEGSNHSDTLFGSAAANNLSGGAAADLLVGAGGNDTLAGGAGADTMNGSSGVDTATYAGESSAVVVDLGAGTGGGAATGDAFSSVESAIGSGFDDTLTGGSGANIFDGAAGDDSLNGGDGDDTFLGAAGADAMRGGAGSDTADYAGSSSAIFAGLASVGSVGDAAGDTFFSIETIIGSAFDDSFQGNMHSNALQGGFGNDTLGGDDGDDLLVGGAGGDSLLGENGADTIIGGADGDFIDAGAGIDVVDYSTVTSAIVVRLSDTSVAGDTLFGVEIVVGSRSNDLLVGDDTDNQLISNGGTDTLVGGLGADTMQGGGFGQFLGVVDYSISSGPVFVNLDTGDTGAAASGDVLISIGALIGSAFDDTLSGSGSGSGLAGGAGNDLLIGLLRSGGSVFHTDAFDGGDGDDILMSGSVATFYSGGAGFDTVTYERASNSAFINLNPHRFNGGSAINDRYSLIEKIIGTDFADSITAHDFSASFVGGAGRDSLTGGMAGDSLDGGNGHDLLLGKQGDDSIVGGAGRDVVSGEDGDDLLQGLDGHDSLYAGNGNDDLDGGLARDLIGGSGGNDTAQGSVGDDRLFGGGGADSLSGGDDDDSLIGGGGTDRLKGDAGNDTLNGSFGADSLSGGAGDDLVEFRQTHGADVIDDFSAGAASEDVIRLIAFGAAFDSFAEVFGAAAQTGADVVIDFGGGDTLTLAGVSLAALHADDFVFG